MDHFRKKTNKTKKDSEKEIKENKNSSDHYGIEKKDEKRIDKKEKIKKTKNSEDMDDSDIEKFIKISKSEDLEYDSRKEKKLNKQSNIFEENESLKYTDLILNKKLKNTSKIFDKSSMKITSYDDDSENENNFLSENSVIYKIDKSRDDSLYQKSKDKIDFENDSTNSERPSIIESIERKFKNKKLFEREKIDENELNVLERAKRKYVSTLDKKEIGYLKSCVNKGHNVEEVINCFLEHKEVRFDFIKTMVGSGSIKFCDFMLENAELNKSEFFELALITMKSGNQNIFEKLCRRYKPKEIEVEDLRKMNESICRFTF